jgi:hypothetical protein
MFFREHHILPRPPSTMAIFRAAVASALLSISAAQLNIMAVVRVIPEKRLRSPSAAPHCIHRIFTFYI